MRIVLLVIGSLVLLVIAFLAWRYIATSRAEVAVQHRIDAQCEPILRALAAGRPVAAKEIDAIAAQPAPRATLYRALCAAGKQNLFPAAWKSLDKIAESDMVVWLLHPNELGAIPDEIELMKTIERTGDIPPETSRFFIFRYRMHPPHWAAGEGWLAGVAGPYGLHEDPMAPPACVFSRFEAFDAFSPEQHLARTESVTR